MKKIIIIVLTLSLFLFSLQAMAADKLGCFTPEILAEFDGQGDTPGYVAVNGRVYDVTEVWEDGTHGDHKAGSDISKAFSESPHDREKLEELEMVGYYIKTVVTGETLSKFDGQDGKPACVAVNGLIYNVTGIWKDGTHGGHTAGNDISEAFMNDSPHEMDKLKKVPIVGFLVDKTFTPEELARFDGQEGRKAYVAVDDIVYDITEIWKGGNHAGHKAGTDLTEEVNKAPHGRKPLARVPIVGILETE